MKKTAQTDSLDQALTLLGGLSPRQFMRRYWQKKPLLIRQAMPGVQSPIERSKLFALAEPVPLTFANLMAKSFTRVRKSWCKLLSLRM